MIAEGLEKKPVEYIATQIAENGFNCVRFTWATFMLTRPDYGNLTVSQSLDKYKLANAKVGIYKNNPRFLNMKVRRVHRAVVNELGKKKLMVVLDNHVSHPGWCCHYDDGNGFFGDASFDPIEWLKGLKQAASIYKTNPAVVGMSLRNELRGKRQNQEDWYRFMQDGANTIHKESPNFLVIISGLISDSNLRFLRTRPLVLNLNNKLVYEAHWYSFRVGADEWRAQTNNVCAAVTRAARDNYLFLTTGDDPHPLILSEFGVDQTGGNEADNRYSSCVLAELATRDIDWALWALQGSYMLREGGVNFDEHYEVMDHNWDRPRNPGFIRRLQFVSQLNQGSNSNRPTHYVIFHPQSGKCVKINKTGKVILARCTIASRWDQHRDGGPITSVGTRMCLTLSGAGGPAGVSNDCSRGWKSASSSGLHLAAQNRQGKHLCLEKSASDSTVMTKKCLCVRNDLTDLPTCADNPQAQWFKLVPRNV